MTSNETQHLIELLKSRHRLEVLQATLRHVERSGGFDPRDEAVMDVKDMFQRQIEVELGTISEPAD